MADVSVEGKKSGVNQDSEVSSTKPEPFDNGPSCQRGDGSVPKSPVKFGSSTFTGAQNNHFPLRTSVLSPSVLGGKGSGESTPGRSAPFVLNPPQLSNPFSKAGKVCMDSKAGRSIPFVLNPPRLSNPFSKGDKEEKTDKEEETTNEKAEPEDSEESKDTPVATTPTKSKTESSQRSSVSFVPLKCETPQSQSGCPVAPATSSPSLGFVFGQNLHERVEAAAVSTDNGSSPEPEKPAVPVSDPEPKTNGATSEMLFTAAVKKETPDKTTDGGGKTLIEAAREYEEARAVKRKYEAVTVVTGEEDEWNVLQLNCKLFAFDKCTCSWVERGRGTLRLNDLPTNPSQSRLIVRVVGSLRLVLNTKIWGGMSVGRASQKSLRITAMDSSQVVRVFLIMASPKETDQLQKALEWRISNLKKTMDKDESCESKKSRTENQDESNS